MFNTYRKPSARLKPKEERRGGLVLGILAPRVSLS